MRWGHERSAVVRGRLKCPPAAEVCESPRGSTWERDFRCGRVRLFREIGVRVEKVFTTVNTVYCERPLVRVARQVLSVIARRPSALSPCSHAVHACTGDLFL